MRAPAVGRSGTAEARDVLPVGRLAHHHGPVVRRVVPVCVHATASVLTGVRTGLVGPSGDGLVRADLVPHPNDLVAELSVACQPVCEPRCVCVCVCARARVRYRKHVCVYFAARVRARACVRVCVRGACVRPSVCLRAHVCVCVRVSKRRTRGACSTCSVLARSPAELRGRATRPWPVWDGMGWDAMASYLVTKRLPPVSARGVRAP